MKSFYFGLAACAAIIARSFMPGDMVAGTRADNPAPAVVSATIKVYDKAGDTIVAAKRQVPKHSNAFDVMRQTVEVEFTTYAGLGPFVTAIAGVVPPAGQYWALYVDGTYSQLGIGNITIDKDILIEWKLSDLQSHPEVGQRVQTTARIMDKDGKEIRNHVIDYTIMRVERLKP
jgi:hypothetical protein